MKKKAQTQAAVAPVTERVLTLRQLIEAEATLRNLGQPVITIVDGKAVAVPQRVSLMAKYRVNMLRKQIEPMTQAFHEGRNQLLTDLGTERPATAEEKAAGIGQTAVDLGAHAGEFNRQIDGLLKSEATIARWLLTYDTLDAFGDTISTQDLAALIPLLIDEPSEG